MPVETVIRNLSLVTRFFFFLKKKSFILFYLNRPSSKTPAVPQNEEDINGRVAAYDADGKAVCRIKNNSALPTEKVTSF
jgi:hypothetical protein